MWLKPRRIWLQPRIRMVAGELKQAIDAYANTVGFEYGGIYEIDGSKRSSHSNAFFTGFGKLVR